MYAVGIIGVIISGIILRKQNLWGEPSFVMELPPTTSRMRGVLRQMWDRGKGL